MNAEMLKGKWNQLQGDVKKQWSKLTNDDISYINGEEESLIGKLQELYGYTKEQAKEQVDKWYSSQQ